MKRIHMIGNAHIDPVWLWQWREGYQEIKATFQSALDRMNETEDFIFTCACTDYYIWVEENAPAMFEAIRARIKEGRWRIVGGMWVQPDCNMPSGEALARHLLYSQRYFKEKFGVTVRTGYNVDTFGHSGMLPQLLKRAGIENYVFLRPGAHENPDIPSPLFTWTSMDGSSVTAFRLIDGYGSRFGDLDQKIETALAVSTDKGYPVMCFYGVGNHGGGPTIKNIASLKKLQKELPEGSEVVFSSPDEYFDGIRALNLDLPKWDNELQHHASGCYAAFSPIKRMNRKSELALVQAEIFSSMSRVMTGHEMDSVAMMRGWSNLMFNQFHDVLCGCSIWEAYEDALYQLGESVAIAQREENQALQKISWRIDTIQGVKERVRSKEIDFSLWGVDGLGTPVIVFNPHAFEVTGCVQVRPTIEKITDENNNEIPVQVVRASRTNGKDKWDSIFEATVPALGYRLYWIYKVREDTAPEVKNTLTVTETTLENAFIRAAFDKKTGAMTSLVTKADGREHLASPATARLFNIEKSDTWAHMDFVFGEEKGTFSDAAFTIVEKGPVRATLRVVTKFATSELIQDYSLTPDATEIAVSAHLNLFEKFRHVKLCFPVADENPLAHAELSYGVIERQPNGEEETGHRFMQLGGKNGGIALLNDSKYSFNATGNELRLTVASSGIFADHYGQETRDEFCRFQDMGEQTFRYAIVPHSGCWKKAGLARRAALFNQPLTHIVETYHEGDLPVVSEGARVSADNILIGAIKRAEDGNGFILRLHETTGTATTAKVELPLFGRTIDSSFTPCEVKTLLLPDDAAAPVKELMLTEWES